jgi:hypothetical protein
MVIINSLQIVLRVFSHTEGVADKEEIKRNE